MSIQRTRRVICVGVAGLCALAAPSLVDATLLYRGPAYGLDNATGETLQRDALPQILGEANPGLYLPVGRGGQGVDYAPRSLLCPVEGCPEVRAATASR